MALTQEERKKLQAYAEQRGTFQVPNKRQEQQTTLQKVAQGLAGIVNATGVPRAAVNAYNLTSSLGTLGAAGIAKLTGNDEMANRFVREAGDEAVKVRNVPFLGKLAPVGSSGDFGKDVKDVVGTGLQIGSTIVGGGAAGGAAKTGLRTLAKEGLKEGVKIGAATGASYEGGRALSDDADALQILERTLVGGLGGGVIGGAVGVASPILSRGAASVGRGVQRTVQGGKEVAENVVNRARGIRNPLPGTEREPGIISGIVENVRTTANKAKGALERSKINVQAQREAREAFESLAPESQNAIRKGLLPRDVELIKTGNQSERGIFKRIVDAAEDYETNRGTANRPSVILGEEYRKRITGLNSALNDATTLLDDTVTGLGNVSMPKEQTINSVLERMSNAPGLNGLNIDERGLLDFTNTTLSGSNSATARKEIQRIFNDVVKRADNPERLHLYRKELFEDLGGKTKSGIKLTATEEKAVNAMRQGMADTIETVAPAYKQANERVAKLLDMQKQIRQRFGDVAQGNEDIFDLKSSILLRRLTSNTKTGQEIAGLLRDLETLLGSDYGITFDTNLLRIQEFLNLLDRYYDIAPDTSLLGIERTALPGSKSEILQKMIDIVGENFKATDETAKQAIRELLGN